MAKRITITIPDSLRDRLHTVKDRINVSGICQEAIAKAIEYEELKAKEMPAMEKLIERLRMEKAKEEKDWKREGLRQGKADALRLSYNDFMRIENSHDDFFNYGLDTNSVTGVLQGNRKWLDEEVSKLRDNYPAFDEVTYLRGWLEGVMEVWKQVKNKL